VANKVIKSIGAFAAVAFLLLGVLFGMQIMTFIFAQLGPANSGLTVADPGYNESLIIQNNSLQSIVSYTGQADTQMTTVAIAITLAILIALFLLFWVFFIKPSRKSGGVGSGGNFA
jgi:hypothetical protein